MKQLKKIIFAFLLALIFGTGAAKVTRALLQDTEESLGNTITGATINLQVGDNDPSNFSFSFNNVVPREIHQLWTEISSIGGIGGNFWLELQTSNSLELNNPEGETDIIGEGELDDCAEVQLVFDDNMGHEVLALPFTKLGEVGPVDSAMSTQVDGFVQSGARMNLQLRTDACGNESMGDAFDLDLIFHLDQV